MNDTQEQAAKILSEWEIHIDSLYDEYTVLEENDPTVYEELISLMDSKLFTDKELVKEICKQGWDFLNTNEVEIASFCSEEVKNDRDTALVMVKSVRTNLRLLNDELKDDKEFILEALQHGDVLEYASERLRDDSDIVHLAIKNKPKAIAYASDRFKKDKKLMLQLVNENNYVIVDIHSDLMNEAYFLLDCWKVLKHDNNNSGMRNHYYASTLIRQMGKEIQAVFSQVDLNAPMDTLNKQMNSCFNQYILAKELNTELKIGKQPKRLKV
jgi:hypothetical protein